MRWALAVVALACACAPEGRKVPGYGTTVSNEFPWPMVQWTRTNDLLSAEWPRSSEREAVVEALGHLHVVFVTAEPDFEDAWGRRVAGLALSEREAWLAAGYPTVFASAYSQEAIHCLLMALGYDPYITEKGFEDFASDADRALAAELQALEERAHNLPE